MKTGLAVLATLSSIRTLSLNRIDAVRNEYTELLKQFPELTRLRARLLNMESPIRGHPVFAGPRQLAPDKLVTAKREFEEMIRLG